MRTTDNLADYWLMFASGIASLPWVFKELYGSCVDSLIVLLSNMVAVFVVVPKFRFF